MAQESEAVADEDAREEARDEGYDLDRKAVARILYAVDTDDREQLVELMEPRNAVNSVWIAHRGHKML